MTPLYPPPHFLIKHLCYLLHIPPIPYPTPTPGTLPMTMHAQIPCQPSVLYILPPPAPYPPLANGPFQRPHPTLCRIFSSHLCYLLHIPPIPYPTPTPGTLPMTMHAQIPCRPSVLYILPPPAPYPPLANGPFQRPHPTLCRIFSSHLCYMPHIPPNPYPVPTPGTLPMPMHVQIPCLPSVLYILPDQVPYLAPARRPSPGPRPRAPQQVYHNHQDSSFGSAQACILQHCQCYIS